MEIETASLFCWCVAVVTSFLIVYPLNCILQYQQLQTNNKRARLWRTDTKVKTRKSLSTRHQRLIPHVFLLRVS